MDTSLLNGAKLVVSKICWSEINSSEFLSYFSEMNPSNITGHVCLYSQEMGYTHTITWSRVIVDVDRKHYEVGNNCNVVLLISFWFHLLWLDLGAGLKVVLFVTPYSSVRRHLAMFIYKFCVLKLICGKRCCKWEAEEKEGKENIAILILCLWAG